MVNSLPFYGYVMITQWSEFVKHAYTIIHLYINLKLLRVNLTILCLGKGQIF